jgi:uncharacterized membrane-anchored protein
MGESTSATSSTRWRPYVVTRPIGASVADWLGKPANARGLGWGNEHVALGLSVLIVLVGPYLATTSKDAELVSEPV